MSLMPTIPDGYYDGNGEWQRTKFCHVSCGAARRANMTNEEFYDIEIAPKLMELGTLCQDKGMSFSCFVEYAPSQYGETSCIKAEASVAFRMILWAAAAHGNIDSLVIAVAKYAQKHGHSSMILNTLKVPTSPEQRSGD